MMSLKKSFAVLAFLSTCISFNALAADTSNVAELETTVPSAEGALTADQIQPITLPKTAGAPTNNPAVNIKAAN